MGAPRAFLDKSTSLPETQGGGLGVKLEFGKAKILGIAERLYLNVPGDFSE